MSTKWIVAYTCESFPCNNRTAVIKVVNMTLPASDQEQVEEYDHSGAMRFIVATVLVYSLIGVFGMLLLRIKRSAMRSQRTITMQDETLQKYLRQQEELALEGRRDRLKRETKRMTKQMEYVMLRPKSTTSTVSDSTGIGEESSFLYSSGLSSSEDTLNLSPRSTHFPLVKFTSKENLRTSLPTLFEGREELKTDESGIQEADITVHRNVAEIHKPSAKPTYVDLDSAMPTEIEVLIHQDTHAVRLNSDVDSQDGAHQRDIIMNRTPYEIV